MCADYQLQAACCSVQAAFLKIKFMEKKTKKAPVKRAARKRAAPKKAVANKNMELWNSVCETDPTTVREFYRGGKKFTTPNAQSQKKRATELWGPMGGQWGIKSPEYGYVRNGAGDVIEVWYEAILYYPGGEIPISSDVLHSTSNTLMGSGNNRKSVRTDALTKGLSDLGFNSDIFEGKHDNEEYVDALREKYGLPRKEKDVSAPAQKVATKKDDVGAPSESSSNNTLAEPKGGAVPKPTFTVDMLPKYKNAITLYLKQGVSSKDIVGKIEEKFIIDPAAKLILEKASLEKLDALIKTKV